MAAQFIQFLKMPSLEAPTLKLPILDCLELKNLVGVSSPPRPACPRHPGSEPKSPGAGISGFSLLELVVVLALISLLMWLAVPRYEAQQHQASVTAMQLELLGCVQTLHSVALAANPDEDSPWLTLADGDGDGVGDQANGVLAEALCPISSDTKRAFDIQVRGSAEGFQLTARDPTPGAEEQWTVDQLGRQSWASD